ncbi:ATP-dependent helicase protein [Rhizobium phage RHph_Y65]|uniref:ATP-dependent helicase protein n=1 Tax=Rhizobium phage RHph_Y65 TaxID=2509785 RepID=A0A7S5RC97_9CAUD|nr:ATP-dependent helicase protein [Rhizobium phage RHph_Y65]QIG72856.1 ATP-dependent helicase protein [Rhizobium phage RHph_Y65]
MASRRIYSQQEIDKITPMVWREIDKQFPFDSARSGQKDLIFRIVKAYMEGKKYFILEAPTGTGKSVIGTTAAKVISALFTLEAEDDKKAPPSNSCVCTKTKALQKQYSDSFPDIVTLWSKTGYPCNLEPYNPDAYYGSYTCSKKYCKLFNECNFRVAREKFNSASVGTLNYAYYLNFRHYRSKVLILDECHTLEQVLCNHLSVKFNVEFTHRTLQVMLKYDLISSELASKLYALLTNAISIKDTMPRWFLVMKSIIQAMKPIVSLMVSNFGKLQDEIDMGNYTIDPTAKKNLYHHAGLVNTLEGKLYKLLHSSVEWVISERKDNDFIELKPVELHEEAHILFNRCEFAILMSATICGIQVFAENLGIKLHEYSSAQLNSTVPVENRRVYSVGLPSFSRETKEEVFPLYVHVMDELISQFAPNDRGIIHSVSYDNARFIVDNSKHSHRMKIPESYELMHIKDYMSMEDDRIIVTPAAIEGLDLEGDLSRFQAFLKVPYPYLGDKWVARKKEISNDWYLRETISAIVQGAGRSVRGGDDYATTFIMDSNFDRLTYRGDLIPQWFSEAIVKLG